MVFRALRVNRAEVFGRICSPFDALLTVLGAAPRRCLGFLFKGGQQRLDRIQYRWCIPCL